MSDTTGDAQDRYISIFEAARILRVSLERITWFIATGQISSIKNPRNKSDKLVSYEMFTDSVIHLIFWLDR